MEKEITFKQDGEILHRLFLNSYLLKDPGLLFGKLGIAIACLDYGKRNCNKVVSDFGDELSNGILNNVDYLTNFDFATGLAGIGWGIEYIIQQMNIDCCSNIICKDLDKQIENISLCRMKDYSLDSGLEGILHYVLMRIKGALMQNCNVPFSSEFLDDLSACLCPDNLTRMPLSLITLAKVFENFRKDGKNVSYQPDIHSFIEGKVFSEEISTARLGLKKGLAGWLYYL